MRGLVRWFIHNPIAANLLMLLILFAGISTFPQVDKTFFPDRVLNTVSVQVIYPGASPQQVQQQIVVRVEEAIDDLDGIDKVTSLSREGLAAITVSVRPDYDSQRLLNDIKARVESLSTLPADAERPLITERLYRSRVISVAVAADLPERELKELGSSLREQLAARPDIQLVDLRQPRAYEMAIEIPEANLRRYGLDFETIRRAIASASINLSAGRIRADTGDIQVQALGQDYTAEDFRNIPVINATDGARVLLGDIAVINDGFVEDEVISYFNGKRSLSLDVFVSGGADILKTSAAVEKFVKDQRRILPDFIELAVWRDMSVEFRGRLNTLINNGFGGLGLIFILLLLFLRPLLAFWVCSGIAVALLGAIALLPTVGISLNMVSLFAFIMILGIVVDDAIIVGESIYTEQSGDHSGLEAAERGTYRVMKPVWFAVITTMIFFLPFLALPPDQPEPYNMGWVVLIALGFSLVESMFILPSHLAHMPPEQPDKWAILKPLEILRGNIATGTERFIDRVYRPLLERVLRWRGTVIALFFVLFTATTSIFLGGWMQFSFFPVVPMGQVTMTYEIKPGIPFSEIEEFSRRVQQGAQQLKVEYNDASPLPVVGHIESVAFADQVRVSVAMLNADIRSFTVDDFERRWRQANGNEDLTEHYQFSASIFDVGKPVELQVSATTVEELREIAGKLSTTLRRFPGVYDVRDGMDEALPELQLQLKPEADRLGVKLQDVIRRLRQGIYGEEIQRIPRGEEDVKVMLRYPLAERRSADALADIRIRTASGGEVALSDVAEFRETTALKVIERIDGRVATVVSSELETGYSAADILAELFNTHVPKWIEENPGAEIKLKGEQEEQAEFVGRITQLTALAMIVIYALFAIIFRSYWQPILVMSAIPFGLMGAILGHLAFDREISMFSILGVVAVAGVVVNDNLVMLDRINFLKDQGMAIRDAILQGASDRFRPILLTSATTFSGLTPIMMEDSIQAQFLIPMVLSLGFGVLLASFVTLLFVPALTDLGHSVVGRLSGGEPPVTSIESTSSEATNIG